MVTPPATSLAFGALPEYGTGWDDFFAELSIDEVSVGRRQLKAQAAGFGSRQDSLLYVAEGEVVFRLADVEYRMGPGGLLHLSRGQTCTALAGASALVLELKFTALLMNEINLTDLLDLPPALQPGVNSIVGQHFVAALGLEQMAPIGRSQCLRSLATLALIALVRDHVPDAGEMLDRTHVKQVRRLLPAIRLLRTNVAAVHTVESLARSCHLSVAQFRRLFCAKFSMSPTRYIQQMRVREACRLLNYSDQTVGEICVRIGYEQPSHFHKTFKRLVGLTPRGYREEWITRRAG